MFIYRKKISAFILTILLMCSFVVNAQTGKIKITGTVITAEESMVLPGVNIFIKGTSTGTVSNVDGKYEIQCEPGNVLVYSFVGYVTEERTIVNQSIIDVSLQSDIESLSEVVVIGYGTVKKSHLSGSVGKVKNDKLDQIPIARADQALRGKLAGVRIQQTDASAGAAPKITIRGVSSINTSSSPLIVVDGYPIPDNENNDGLASIDMSNVESIEVLKDAASAAIYGSRASNGVIMVTTKSGSERARSINFSSYVGVKSVYPYDHIYSTVEEWADFAYADAAERGLTMDARIPAMESLGTYTDWEDLAIRDDAKIQNYNLNVSGGNEDTHYYLGIGYSNEDGILETNTFDKYTFTTKLDTKVKNWLELGTSINGTYSNQRVAAASFHDMVRTQAWCPVYHTEETAAYAQAAGFDVQAGDLAHEYHFTNVNGVNLVNSANNNGWAYLHGQNKRYITLNAIANTYAKIKISDHIDFKTNFGINYKDYENKYFMASYTKPNGDTKGTYSYVKTLDWLNENVLNYHNIIGNHDIGAIVGFSSQSNSASTASMSVSDYLTDEIETLNAGSTLNSASTEDSRSTMVSAFFRVNYAYKDKYIASVSSRWDGSSRFGSNNKWAYFPAFSVAWRVSEEEFMKPINLISELKLRASYGSTGNNNIGDYKALDAVEPGADAYFGTTYSGYTQSSIANPSLSWEKTNETDFGMDLGLLKNRIYLGIDYYNIKTDALLLDREVPSVTGFTNAWTNMGKVQNKGFEFEITSHNIVKDNFTWSTTANCYTNDNTLVDFAGIDEYITTPDASRPHQFIAKVGDPLVQFYGYEIDYSKGENGSVPREWLQSPYYPIDVGSQYAYVKDQNGDGVITDDDRVVLGDPYSDFNWSITNNFTYKNFDLSFMFEGSHGAQVLNIDAFYWETHWKGGYVSGVADEDFLKSKVVTDYFIQDADFVTLRNLILGYSIPTQLSERIKISSLRIYFTASNLLYFMADNYTGLNPEGINTFSSNINFGYQRGAAPVQRTFCLGLDIKF